jgi:hypothetical protein
MLINYGTALFLALPRCHLASPVPQGQGRGYQLSSYREELEG